MMNLVWAETGAEKAASLFGGLLLILAVVAGLLAFSALAVAFFRDRLEMIATNAQKRSHRNLWIGLGVYVLLLALTKLLGSFHLNPLVGLSILILLCLLLLSFVIAAQEIGLRLAALRAQSSPLSTTLMGALALVLAFFLPILGQILWVIMLSRGLGAWLTSPRGGVE